MIDSTERQVNITALKDCVVTILEHADVPADDAGLIADMLVDAELRGHADHGPALLGLVIPWYRAGSLNPRPRVRVVQETASALLLDGDHGLGVLPSLQAMRWCIDHARAQQGIACAGVRHAGHCIASAPYVALAAEAGVIGFACTNSRPLMAPPGGRTPTLSTNPLAYGVPAGRHPPIVFDMATSTTAATRVVQSLALGEPVPEGWIADAQGQPTTDPRHFVDQENGRIVVRGLMLPLGSPAAGHKGFGLAMLVDLLAGVLTGGAFARQVSHGEGDVGHFFWALDPAAFGPREEFLARVDDQIDQIKGSERLEGVDEIVFPGERGHYRRERLLAGGWVPIGEATWSVLTRTCEMVGVSPPSIRQVETAANNCRGTVEMGQTHA